LFEGPHNKGTTALNSLSAFIDGLPNDGKSYTYRQDWNFKVIPDKIPSDYDIAVGGSQVHADGEFSVSKGMFKPNEVIVTGNVQYSLLDKFDFNKGSSFFKGLVTGDEMNLLERCGKAAPFWHDAKWQQDVKGFGTDDSKHKPQMNYVWTDK
jgi:hypothetical protein